MRSARNVSAQRGLCLLISLFGMAPLAAFAGRAYVSNEDGASVTVIDTDRQEVVATVDVGKRPRGLKVSPDGASVYVAVSGLPRCPPTEPEAVCAKRKHDLAADGIAVIDTATLKLVKVLKAGTDPEQFDVSPDGKRLFISNEDAASITVLEVASGQVKQKIPVGNEPEGARVTPDGKLVVITSEVGNAISVIDASSLKVLRTVSVGKRPRDAAFTPDNTVAYITGENDSSLYRTALTKDEPATKLLQLRPEAKPMGVVIDNSLGRLYVSTGRGGTVAVIAVDGGKLLAEIPVGARPWGIALSRDGKRLYTANGPSNDVTVVDTGTQKVLTKIPAGHLPWGIALSP
jgi:YVTN family beta-propeller protein